MVYPWSENSISIFSYSIYWSLSIHTNHWDR